MTKASAKNPFGDFATVMAQIAEEKGIDKDRVVDTVAAAIAAAYKKEYGKKGQNIRAEFDPVSGDMKFFLVKEVVDETTREFPVDEDDKDTESDEKGKKEVPAHDEDEERLTRYNGERDLTLEEAKETKKDAKVGDIIEEELESKSDFGRVAAQTAKQVIIQRIREAERDVMFEEFKNKEGEVISGTIQRIEGRTVFVDMGKSVGALFPSEQIRDEHYHVGQRLKLYVAKVESDPKGPGVTLSRTHPEMVRKLFELEVPEIFAGTVEIKSIAREAGSRSKIAVYTEEEGIDPIGSCVGQKGTRVQAVIDEMGGEKVDIIEWSDDTEDFITAALSPAKVIAVNVDEEKKIAEAIVPDDQLSLAIGKRGQNVRLAVKLTGYNIDVVSEAPEDEAQSEEASSESDTSEQEESGVAEEAEQKEEITEEKAEAVTSDAVDDAPEEENEKKS